MFNQNASQGQSQYRGMQTAFQPTGFVNSVYGQGQNSNFGGNQSGNMQSYQTAQYRANQPGHDNNLRADSVTSAQQQGQTGFSQNQFSSPQSQFGSQQLGSQQFGSQPYGMGSQSYGNQQFGGQQGQFGSQQGQLGGQQNQMGRSSYGMSSNTGFGGTTPDSSSFGSQVPSSVSQQYHASNYRGNQQGHDYYLRADATNPAQQQGQFANQNQLQSQGQFANQNQLQNQNQFGAGFYGRGQ